ncbi:MAG: fused MFS/spermidine synthase [Nitrospiria bacterium]
MKKVQPRVDFVLLLMTVFICGMIVLVLEVLGSRILGPYFGISLFIWTSLITITLISLSLGYWIGGIISDRYQTEDLFYFLILGAGFLVMFIPIIQKPVSLSMTFLGPRFGSLLTAFILFTLPLTLLGIVAPFSLKLSLKRIDQAGKIAGNLYALSTLGGILGTLMVGFWFIPNVGLRNIFFILSITLSVLPAVHFIRRKNVYLIAGSIGVMMMNLFLIYYFSKASRSGEILYKSESFYGQLKVLDRDHLHLLMVDGAVQTAYQTDLHRSNAPYTGLIEEILSRYRSQTGNKTLEGVVIGLGGGIIPEAELKAGDLIDIVELDPRMPQVARQYFEFHPEKFNLILKDARHFLNTSQKKYDYIILDVFAGESSPFYLLSRECFDEVRRGLKDGGILIMNTIGIFAGEGSGFTHSIYKTLHRSFLYQKVFSTSARDNFTNYIMVASGRPLSALTSSSERLALQEVHLTGETGILLSDNYNPVDYLEQETALQWRLAIWRGTSSSLLLD